MIQWRKGGRMTKDLVFEEISTRTNFCKKSEEFLSRTLEVRDRKPKSTRLSDGSQNPMDFVSQPRPETQLCKLKEIRKGSPKNVQKGSRKMFKKCPEKCPKGSRKMSKMGIPKTIKN